MTECEPETEPETEKGMRQSKHRKIVRKKEENHTRALSGTHDFQAKFDDYLIFKKNIISCLTVIHNKSNFICLIF